jgi:hypothetical protein
MTASTDHTVALLLRNIEVGPATQTMRADPTPADPGRRTPRSSRECQLTFDAAGEGIAATFTIHIGWDGRDDEPCPVEQLEDVGRSLVMAFAKRLS